MFIICKNNVCKLGFVPCSFFFRQSNEIFLFRNKSEIWILVYLERILLLWIFEFQARICTEDHSMGQIKRLSSSSGKKNAISVFDRSDFFCIESCGNSKRIKSETLTIRHCIGQAIVWVVSRRSVTAGIWTRVSRQPTGYLRWKKSVFFPTTSVQLVIYYDIIAPFLFNYYVAVGHVRGRGSTETFSRPTTRIAK
jgi:hypothetical protein